jgi:hypothetical protein
VRANSLFRSTAERVQGLFPMGERRNHSVPASPRSESRKTSSSEFGVESYIEANYAGSSWCTITGADWFSTAARQNIAVNSPRSHLLAAKPQGYAGICHAGEHQRTSARLRCISGEIGFCRWTSTETITGFGRQSTVVSPAIVVLEYNGRFKPEQIRDGSLRSGISAGTSALFAHLLRSVTGGSDEAFCSKRYMPSSARTVWEATRSLCVGNFCPGPCVKSP